MTSEHKYIGAFMNISLKKVYDIWEIPPFGNYNNSTYKGLHLDRIDCLLISNGLVLPAVGPTNGYIRYKNYLEPYSKYLQENGAKTYVIPKYGTVIIYESVQKTSDQIERNNIFCLINNPIYNNLDC